MTLLDPNDRTRMTTLAWRLIGFDKMGEPAPAKSVRPAELDNRSR